MSNVLPFRQTSMFDPESETPSLLPVVRINEERIIVREYMGTRVVTFDVIDSLHKRPKGTAARNFHANKDKFIENEDFMYFEGKEGREALQLGSYTNFVELNNNGNFSFYLLTQTGYLMLVKSLRDDLAWKIQRELINGYFTKKDNQDMFSIMRKMIDTLEENQKALEMNNKAIEASNVQINAAAERLDKIDEMMDIEISPDWVNAHKIAAKLNLFSTKDSPHSLLVSAIAKKVGFLVNKRAQYKDDCIQIVGKREGAIFFWEVYYSPEAVDVIKEWWENNKNTCYFEILYKKKTTEHVPGDLKEAGYRIGGRNYLIKF